MDVDDTVQQKIQILKRKIRDLKEEVAKYEIELEILEMQGRKGIANGEADAKMNENSPSDERIEDIRQKDKRASDLTSHSQEKLAEMSSNGDACNSVESVCKREDRLADSGHKVSDPNLNTSTNLSGHGDYIVAKFSKHITERYSRQIILDQIGVAGQEALLRASVLIIGCGGIGSPCIQYLAACGIGTLGLVDYDHVELSNLHRQVIHSTATIGQSKVTSAKAYVHAINPNVTVRCYESLLDASNAFDTVTQYDIVLDASDNAPTRYLVNDACVKARRPLISASALGLDGQLCVLNHKEAPCYRCIYPIPPPPETVGSCGENGVLGPVPGLMGTLQAIEAVKLLLGLPVLEKLLLYDAERSAFLAVKLRAKKPDCLCANPAEVELIDYERFCSSRANDKAPNISLLSPSDHISVRDYLNNYLASSVDHILLDVRNTHEYDMVRLRNGVQVDMRQIEPLFCDQCPDALRPLQRQLKLAKNIFVICRRGNDSQKVVLSLKDWKLKRCVDGEVDEMMRNTFETANQNGVDDARSTTIDRASQNGVDEARKNAVSIQNGFDCEECVIKNIKEGYYGWCKYIDDSIPIY